MRLDRFEEIFLQVANAHLQVKSAYRGLNFDLGITGDELYPMFYLQRPWSLSSSDNQFYGSNIANFNISGNFLMLDKAETPMSDYQPLVDIKQSQIESMERCRQISSDIIEWINNEYENEIGFTSVNMVTVEDYTDNRDCGVLVEFTAKIVNAVDKCDLSEKFVF